MTDDLLAEALQNPRSIPTDSQIGRIIQHCLGETIRTFGPLATGWHHVVRFRQSPPFPETTNDGISTVTVWLTTKRSWVGYFFEAAHEAVHCLNPIVPTGPAMYIEEAVASTFSLEVVRLFFGQTAANECHLPQDYRNAIDLASQIDDDVVRLGQRLRESAGALESVTAQTIEELYPHAPQGAVLSSLRRFPKQ